MSGVIRSEVLKLRTSRATIALLLGGVAYAALNGFATTRLAGRDGNAALGSADNIGDVLRAGNISTWVLLLVGVLSLTGEHRHRTIATTYLAVPRRGTVVRAKMLVVGVLGAVYALVTMTAGMVASASELRGAPSLDVLDAHVVRVAGGTLLATVLLGVAGVAIGGAVRNQTAAVVGSFVWLVAGENVVGSVAGWHVARWFPGRAAEAASGGGGDTLLGMGPGAALFAAYVLVATVVATWLTVARDVA